MRDGNNIDYVIDSLTNRYDSVGGSTLTYDAAGNLTKDKNGYTYRYDYENRVIKLKKSNDTITVAEFNYDALGRRIEKKDNITAANTRCYYYNYNWQILSEYNTGGTHQRSYVYGNYIDEVLMSFWLYTASQCKYYLHDHLYSPVAVTDSFGQTAERYEYDAYGKCYILEPNFAPDPDGKSDVANPFYFTGREMDTLDNGSLKIMNYRHRYYDTYTGRFSTHDPVGIIPNRENPNTFHRIEQYKNGLNLYEYVRSNPVANVDPTGLLILMPQVLIKIPHLPSPIWFPSPVTPCSIFKKIIELKKKSEEFVHKYHFVLPGYGNPYSHCVWSCNMAREHGNDYAEGMGAAKEEFDKLWWDAAEKIKDKCWEYPVLRSLRGLVADWICSAWQTSDLLDNAAGRDCGINPKFKDETCVECCEKEKNIWPDTAEGDTTRPYGPLCKGRYKKWLEEKLDRPIEVEN
jgi:RHS repeat-associated protein